MVVENFCYIKINVIDFSKNFFLSEQKFMSKRIKGEYKIPSKRDEEII